LTYDYLCPFARIANETVVAALRDGADWDVGFHPFSLAEVHIDEGTPSVWERPVGASGTRGVRALAWSLAAHAEDADRFLDFHVGLFSARHDDAADVDDVDVLRSVAVGAGLDPDVLGEVVAAGMPLAQLAEAHAEAVKRWSVFGVPTFIVGDEAVFVRLMARHRRDDIERVLDMLDWTRLNEFKRTSIPR
jgi:2-hydroxychromene-2-carboxylate isomerase